ncbi:hypothetical protein A9G24_07070 [Gilliamella sp. App6-5]|uniref:hypothetical protein n=1 Tax=Gilliamella sp. App6-5 TaxID=3120232 RepID=UPI00080E2F6E|nr:hypothetical protein [Gilliamella apicola]OCG13862.1 hypothetical protein A9G24_07070 [Gilliamella apicola]
MKITNKHFKTIIYTIYLLQFTTTSYAALSAKTVHSIEGTKPKLVPILEEHINDFELFGLRIDDKYYYGEDLKKAPIPVTYPFKKRITVAPLKQPNNEQYLDLDGDELRFLNTKGKIDMIWYYTNNSNQLIEFKPTETDTFCSLGKEGKSGPYKVKISADLTLFSKYGVPNVNEYPNENIITHPSKIYTLLEESGFCYAQPELLPREAIGSEKNHWDKNNGFLVQSTVEQNKNFPTTAFYGAQFKLLLAKTGVAKNYDWEIVKGRELVTISSNSDTVTVIFNTTEARNTDTAWRHVMGSNNGYTIIIQGRNKITGSIIQYPFTITKWFSGWDKNLIGQPIANRGSVEQIVSGCKELDGHYRVSYANEVSNAPMGRNARFTREIGTLLGEWGDPNQKAYPGSWAAGPRQGSAFKRIWLYDTVEKRYCDLHTNNAIYHCRGENEQKNGVCTAIK